MAGVLPIINHNVYTEYLMINLPQNCFWSRKERENKQNGIVDPDEVGGGRGGRRRGVGGSRGGALQRRTKTHDQFTKV